MEIRYGKNKRIQFTDRSHPTMGIVSVVRGLGALVALIALCIFSSKAKGNSGLAIGAIGTLAMIMSIIGFILSIKCYQKEDISRVLPTVVSVLNGILVITFLLLVFIGAM